MKPPPPKLYRYEPIDANTLSNLRSCRVYFSSPMRFNDPYDCAIPIALEDIADADIDDLRRVVLDKQDAPDNIKEAVRVMSPENIKRTVLHAVAATLAQAQQRMTTTAGVACFTERNDSLLMWGHYADRYAGMCLEFDGSSDLFARCKPVTYASSLTEAGIRPVDLLADPPSNDFIEKLYRTKAADWSYEREWRSIHDTAGQLYGYPMGSLTGIYFGPRTPEDRILLVGSIVSGRNAPVKLYKGSLSNSAFQVAFEEIRIGPLPPV